jgi:GcrA cell cycle regulator
MTLMEWNDERTAALARLWKDGLSASQVAQQLGSVSRSAVIGKIHRLGISGRDAPSRPRGVSTRTTVKRKATQGGRRQASLPSPHRAAASSAPFEVAPTATMATLTKHGCRWPIGDPGDEAFGFCGRLRFGRGAYCQGHAPMSVGRRLGAMPAKQIDDMVTRFVDAPAGRAL